jgi:hypothetical protein
LKRTIKVAKKIQYSNKINQSSNKVKTMWSIINERTNKKIKSENCNIVLNLNNTPISEPKAVANNFNSFFSSIGESRNISAIGRSVVNSIENTFYLTPVNIQETYKLIKHLKNKNSYGIDEIPPKLMKNCAIELALPFCKLINQSFTDGVFPDALKKAIIKPIHKNNEKSNPTNYRPIAILPTASKIFEKAMCVRIYSYCERYKIFDESQNGFRKKRSTVLAVYKYIQQVVNIINIKQYPVGLLLDMSKAYDKVQYDILLKKMYGVGIRGIALEWFKSYLRNREQVVEIKHYNHSVKEINIVRSDRKIINASIPQGSVLGCLLFLIYINDLPKIINEHCVLFADDISILISGINEKNLNDKIKIIMDKTNNWMTDHNLEINFFKTKLMTFQPYQKAPLSINFYYKNNKLDVVDELTLLGIAIDTYINWKPHIQKIKSKFSKFIYAFLEIKKTTNMQTALAMYYAYAYAWLNYGVIMWGNSTDAPSLFILQKKIIRILVNIGSTDSCKPHFIHLQILTLPCIYIYEICKFVRKYSEFFTKRIENNPNYRLRNKNKLIIPTSRIKLHLSSTQAMAVKIYNNLPEQLRNLEKDIEFLNKLKTTLLQKAYYTIEEYLSDKLIM